MEILKEKEMTLLSRKRVTLLVENSSGTPSRLSLIKNIAKKFKTSEENVIIKHVYPQFGMNQTKLIVHIYSDKAKPAVYEHKNLVKKHLAKEQPKEDAADDTKASAPVDAEDKNAQPKEEKSE